MDFNSIEDAIERIANGGLVIVLDAEDRENEGDFICAAEKLTPDMVNFMLKEGRGEFCVPVLPEDARRLELQPAAERNNALNQTAFTVTVDHRSCKTGVSTQERAQTVLALADPESGT